MSKEEIQKIPDSELQKLWNEAGKIFEGIRPKVSVGILQLSRETERRGLMVSQGRYNKDIILLKKEK